MTTGSWRKEWKMTNDKATSGRKVFAAWFFKSLSTRSSWAGTEKKFSPRKRASESTELSIGYYETIIKLVFIVYKYLYQWGKVSWQSDCGKLWSAGVRTQCNCGTSRRRTSNSASIAVPVVDTVKMVNRCQATDKTVTPVDAQIYAIFMTFLDKKK